MTKESLIDVFERTLDIIKEGGYETNEGKEIGLDTTILEEGSAFYGSIPNMAHVPGAKSYKTVVEVVEKDTFEAAKELGEHCGVLNMASFSRPGGGVLRGSSAQEEELCRRSNLYLSLAYYHNQDYEYLYSNPSDEPQYPIPMYGGVYSPNVTVFRGLGYSLLDKPYHCNVISVPAVRKPKVTGEGVMEEKETKIMKGKIRTIFRIAILHSLKDLVLGAFGCGAYGCPPEHVAKLFKEILKESEFKGRFEKVVFAIIEDKNSEGKNYGAFKKVFN